MSKQSSPPGKKQVVATRINKFIAASGTCSRREADEMIRTGRVKVNDKVITELGDESTT